MGSAAKNFPANAGDESSIPWLGRSPGGGNGNPLQEMATSLSSLHGQRRLVVLQSIELQRVGHDLATQQQQQQSKWMCLCSTKTSFMGTEA